MRHRPEIEEVTVVVIGTFTPGVMSPHWLAFNGLISQDEANEASVTVTHPQVTQIDFGWGRFYADEQRVQVVTSQSPWIRACDFIQKLLSEVTPAQPTRALGLNVSAHYAVTAAEQEAIGHRLAPREIWGGWGANLHNENPSESANGLISITMRQGSNLPNRFNKYIDVRITGSSSIRPNGIEIFINDHYSFQEEPDAALGTQTVVNLISEQFEASLDRSHEIIDGIMGSLRA